MSSAQHRSSFNEFRKSKNRDMAVEEIIRERRVAIMNGQLKGRRLFKAVERATELELDWNCLNTIHEREVNDEKVEISERVGVEGETTVEVSVAAKGGASGNLRVGGGGRRCMLTLAWFAIIATLFTFGLIISMSCSGKYVLEKEVILVPT